MYGVLAYPPPPPPLVPHMVSSQDRETARCSDGRLIWNPGPAPPFAPFAKTTPSRPQPRHVPSIPSLTLPTSARVVVVVVRGGGCDIYNFRRINRKPQFLFLLDTPLLCQSLNGGSGLGSGLAGTPRRQASPAKISQPAPFADSTVVTDAGPVATFPGLSSEVWHLRVTEDGFHLVVAGADPQASGRAVCACLCVCGGRVGWRHPLGEGCTRDPESCGNHCDGARARVAVAACTLLTTSAPLAFLV